MTLQPYNAEKLDQLALRLFDLAAIMRSMANRARENQVDDLHLHDKKAQEWCVKLDHWAHKIETELDIQILQARAERRAMTTGQES